MELSEVPEISDTHAMKLGEAGVPHAEALAIWPDLPPLAERTGIDLERLESFRDAARSRIERALADAGVSEPAALAVAELPPLAQRTRIDITYLEHYQRKAREALGKVVIAADA